VIPTFVRQALAGQPLSVFGTGDQSRCFCHVSDVVVALHELALSDKAVGEVFNVGGEQEITIRALAERVREIVGSQSPIRNVSYDDAYEQGFEDMLRRVPDVSKIRTLTGWRATRSLDDVLRDVIAFERSN